MESGDGISVRYEKRDEVVRQKRKATPMKHQPRLKFCTCDACLTKTAALHGVGDLISGRTWSCQCGACKHVRGLSTGTAEVAFARLDYLDAKAAQVRAVKVV